MSSLYPLYSKITTRHTLQEIKQILGLTRYIWAVRMVKKAAGIHCAGLENTIHSSKFLQIYLDSSKFLQANGALIMSRLSSPDLE